jgi:hypothetical protein
LSGRCSQGRYLLRVTDFDESIRMGLSLGRAVQSMTVEATLVVRKAPVPTEEDTTAVGVGCWNGTNLNASSNGYAFVITPDAHGAILRVDGSEYTALLDRSDDAIFTDRHRPNTVRARCVVDDGTSHLALFVNGKRIGSATDDRFRDFDSFGLYAYTPSGRLDLDIDDFSAKR